jgi:hypothetical protein
MRSYYNIQSNDNRYLSLESDSRSVERSLENFEPSQNHGWCKLIGLSRRSQLWWMAEIRRTVTNE